MQWLAVHYGENQVLICKNRKIKINPYSVRLTMRDLVKDNEADKVAKCEVLME